MAPPIEDGSRLAASLAAAWSSVERTLTGNLSSIRGISYSEYRLLAAIDAAGDRGVSRVELGRQVGLSASAVTRALRPLTELGMVETTKHERDARQALARLTANGEELISDASGVVLNTMADVRNKISVGQPDLAGLVGMLDELARI